MPSYPARSDSPALRSADAAAHAGPLVSIGLPVYNGERYLRQTLDSLLGQDYGNLELILSDNASTDSTAAICQEYAARDARVRYYRLRRNVGAVQNFRHVFRQAHGPYFMWAAFDDLRDPLYVSACVTALEARPDAVACCTGLRLIDEDGQPVDEAAWTHGIRPVGRSAWQRVQAIAQATYWYDFYALTRTQQLAQTRLPLPVWGYDVVVLLELCLRGPVLLVPQPLFAYRVFTHKTQQDLARGLESGQVAGAVPVSWGRMILEMTRSIWRAPLPTATKLRLTLPFLWEFCGRNAVVSSFIQAEGAAAVRRALTERAYGRSLILLGIAGLGSSQYLRRRIVAKLRKELRIT